MAMPIPFPSLAARSQLMGTLPPVAMLRLSEEDPAAIWVLCC